MKGWKKKSKKFGHEIFIHLESNHNEYFSNEEIMDAILSTEQYDFLAILQLFLRIHQT